MKRGFLFILLALPWLPSIHSVLAYDGEIIERRRQAGHFPSATREPSTDFRLPDFLTVYAVGTAETTVTTAPPSLVSCLLADEVTVHPA